MSAIAFLLVALLLSGIGSAVLVLRNRRPTSVESGIDDFRREMSALAPPEPVPLPPRMPEWDDPAEDDSGRRADAARTDRPSRRNAQPSEAESQAGADADVDDIVSPSPADPRPQRREAEKPRSPDEPGAP